MKIYEVNVDLGYCSFTGTFVVLPTETLEDVIKNRFGTEKFNILAKIKLKVSSVYLKDLTYLDFIRMFKYHMEEGLINE